MACMPILLEPKTGTGSITGSVPGSVTGSITEKLDKLGETEMVSDRCAGGLLMFTHIKNLSCVTHFGPKLSRSGRNLQKIKFFFDEIGQK